MSDLKSNDGKQAIYCLEHLLYEVPFSALHNVAAMLAQETNQPVSDFGQKTGHWTFDVVARFLIDRGMACVPASDASVWFLDITPAFLRRSPSFVGFICIDTMTSIKWCDDKWLNSEGVVVEPKQPHMVAVHRMWSAVEPFYRRQESYHVTGPDAGFVRHECRPETCWQSEEVNYEGRSQAVKAYMREHKRGAIMMSNEHEMVLCKPAKHGWKTETLLNYDFIPQEEVSQQVAEVVTNKIVGILESRPENWKVMGHAMYSVLRYLGGRLTVSECSLLTPEELETLQTYEEGLRNHSK